MKNNYSDLEHFLDPENEVTPSKELDHKVYDLVADKPAHHIIFGKLLALQVVVGALTLLVCPQFDLGLGKSFEFFHYIHHKFGMEACYLICGAIFMGPSSLLSLYILRERELERIQKIWPIHFLLLSLTMLLALANFGTTVESRLLFIWLFSAVSASHLAFYFSRRFFQSFSHAH